MDLGTDVGAVDDGLPPPGLPEIVAALSRRVALLEIRNRMVTDATLDDLSDHEAYRLTYKTTEERERDRRQRAADAENRAGG